VRHGGPYDVSGLDGIDLLGDAVELLDEVAWAPNRELALSVRIFEARIAPRDTQLGDGRQRVVGTQEYDQSLDAGTVRILCAFTAQGGGCSQGVRELPASSKAL